MTMPQLPPVPPMAAATAALAPPPALPLAGAVAPGQPPAVLPLAPPEVSSPPPPPPPPPTISPDSVIKRRETPEKITNPFERQAAMIVQTAHDWAGRLASNLGDHPADYAPTDDATVAEMFHFSPFGTDGPKEFWRQHAQLLQLAIQNNDPDPYAVAERGALQAVYPYRDKLALLDQLSPEQKVARAEELLAISHRQIAKGNPPDALPSIVGPAGLPPPEPAPPSGGA